MCEHDHSIFQKHGEEFHEHPCFFKHTVSDSGEAKVTSATSSGQSSSATAGLNTEQSNSSPATCLQSVKFNDKQHDLLSAYFSPQYEWRPKQGTAEYKFVHLKISQYGKTPQSLNITYYVQ